MFEQEVSIKPSAWTGLGGRRDEELAQVKGARLAAVDLRRADVARAFLVKADLRHANLQRADLSAANLHGADLSYANLQGAYLDGAQLERADLSYANLQGASLSGAQLKETNLRHAKLHGAKLVGFPYGFILSDSLLGPHAGEVNHLTQEQLDGACGDDKTKLPPGMTIKPCPEEKSEE